MRRAVAPSQGGPQLEGDGRRPKAPHRPLSLTRAGALGKRRGRLTAYRAGTTPRAPRTVPWGSRGGTCPPFFEGISLERRTRTRTAIATMGHLPSLRTEHDLEAIFGPLRLRGYHFKPLFKEFPAIFRPGTPKPNKGVGTDVRSYESWYFWLKKTFGGLQNQFWAPKKLIVN